MPKVPMIQSVSRSHELHQEKGSLSSFHWAAFVAHFILMSNAVSATWWLLSYQLDPGGTGQKWQRH